MSLLKLPKPGKYKKTGNIAGFRQKYEIEI